jgi:CheY-like chemotaxis protein
MRAGAVPQRFDALLVGHLVPAASAVDLAAAVHELAPDLPILLATASADDFGAHTLVAAGISEVVRRPLISTEIAEALTRCLAAPRTSLGALRS